MNVNRQEGGSREDREFFRVQARIPLHFECIETDRYQRLATEVLGHIDPPLPNADIALIGWLDRIERKLDRLLAHAGLVEEQPAGAPGGTTTHELSGSGLSFLQDEPIEVGTALLLRFELPETPVRQVRCLGRVVDVVAHEGQHEIGVGFETIRQTDRDAVVRYTLAVQRQAILGG